VKERRDHRQEVTNDIVRLIEAGTTPWRRTWDAGYLGLPVNAATGKTYHGGNVLCLMAATAKRGYGDNRWMSYRQAQEAGGQVRKGEKATAIEFWQFSRLTGADGEALDVIDEKARPLHRIYSVFNAAQIDGIEAPARPERPAFEQIAAAESIITTSGVTIKHDGFNRAFYAAASDSIHVPERAAFDDAPSYYGTVLHELTHWTGHDSRLSRNLSALIGNDQARAREELIAELASAFLTAETGIETDLGNSAAYIDSWLSILKTDKNALFQAASAASKAADYLLRPVTA
jgi:antirestriction protein ArdC